jgi:hypothetical protein
MKINEDGRHDSGIKFVMITISTTNIIIWVKGVARKTKENIYRTIMKNIVLLAVRVLMIRQLRNNALISVRKKAVI